MISHIYWSNNSFQLVREKYFTFTHCNWKQDLKKSLRVLDCSYIDSVVWKSKIRCLVELFVLMDTQKTIESWFLLDSIYNENTDKYIKAVSVPTKIKIPALLFEKALGFRWEKPGLFWYLTIISNAGKLDSNVYVQKVLKSLMVYH